jgi:signal transduction histidine kinase
LAKHISSGLAGMRERSGLLGGRMTIESAPGTGTCVAAEFPLGGMSRAVAEKAEG